MRRTGNALAGGVAQGVGFVGPVLHQAVAHAPTQFVALVGQCGGCAAREIAAALEHQHVDAGVHHLPRRQARGEASADEDDGAFGKFVSHGCGAFS